MAQIISSQSILAQGHQHDSRPQGLRSYDDHRLLLLVHPPPKTAYERWWIGQDHREQHAGWAGTRWRPISRRILRPPLGISPTYLKSKARPTPRLSCATRSPIFPAYARQPTKRISVIRKGRRTRNLVHAAGIQSPGITAAPAIAQDISRMATELLGETRTVKANPTNPIRKGIWPHERSHRR